MVVLTTTPGSDYSQEENGESSGYFTTVFKSAKEKASSIKWPQNVEEGVLSER